MLVIVVMMLVGQSATRQRLYKTRLESYVVKPNASGDNIRDRRNETRRKQVMQRMRSLQEGKRHGRSRIGAVRVNIMRAGYNITLAKFWAICGAVGLAASALWDFSGKTPYGTPIVFLVVTFLLPRLFLNFKAKRRQKEFTKNFQSAIDVIVRGLKTGLPVQECFRIIGREIPDPCGSEFRMVIDEVNAGLTLEDALERSFERMPTQELRFFTTVIAIQAQTGGNLAEILGNISGVLRGRVFLREKIKALSAEARMSSYIVGALPFLVCGVLTLVNYSYISVLWTTRKGEYILAAACFMMAAGMFVMNRMANLDM
jgi:tight adherence protein B